MNQFMEMGSYQWFIQDGKISFHKYYFYYLFALALRHKLSVKVDFYIHCNILRKCDHIRAFRLYSDYIVIDPCYTLLNGLWIAIYHDLGSIFE